MTPARCHASSRARGPCRRGFTLLEMMLVLFIVTLLVGAVFGIVGSVTQLTDDMNAEQQRDARIHGFISLCERTFRNLPPSAVVRLRNREAGGLIASQLAFAGGSSPLSADTSGIVVIETGQAVDGYLRVSMRSVGRSEVAAWEKGDPVAGQSIPLLDQVAVLEWKFLDPTTRKWSSLWNDKVDFTAMASAGGPAPPPTDRARETAPRPGIVELRIAFGTAPAERHVFWVPGAQSVRRSGTEPAEGTQP